MRDEETKAGRNHSHNMQRLLKKKKRTPLFYYNSRGRKTVKNLTAGYLTTLNLFLV